MRTGDHRLLTLLVKNALMGIAGGWLLLAILVHANVARLGDLIFGNHLELAALALLGGGFAVTFGSLAMATAVFLLPRD